MDGVSKLLSNDGFIVVNKTLIRELGLHEAIILGELCSEYNYWEKCNKIEGDMFYSTRDNIEYNTGLNEHYQRKAITTLKDKDILSVQRKGIPATNYYKIHFDKILNLLSTRCESREHLDVDTVNLNNKQTEITKKEALSKDNTRKNFDFGVKKQTSKENLYTKCVALIDDKTNNEDVRRLLISWLNMLLEKYRMRGKSLYVNVFKGKLNMLDKFDEKDWGDIVEYNLQRGYEGFYPLPNYNSRCKPWEDSVECNPETDEDIQEREDFIDTLRSNGKRVEF